MKQAAKINVRDLVEEPNSPTDDTDQLAIVGIIPPPPPVSPSPIPAKPSPTLNSPKPTSKSTSSSAARKTTTTPKLTATISTTKLKTTTAHSTAATQTLNPKIIATTKQVVTTISLNNSTTHANLNSTATTTARNGTVSIRTPNLPLTQLTKIDVEPTGTASPSRFTQLPTKSPSSTLRHISSRVTIKPVHSTVKSHTTSKPFTRNVVTVTRRTTVSPRRFTTRKLTTVSRRTIVPSPHTSPRKTEGVTVTRPHITTTTLPAACVPKYAQCGGKGMQDTCCIAPATCVKVNDVTNDSQPLASCPTTTQTLPKPTTHVSNQPTKTPITIPRNATTSLVRDTSMILSETESLRLSFARLTSLHTRILGLVKSSKKSDDGSEQSSPPMTPTEAELQMDLQRMKDFNKMSKLGLLKRQFECLAVTVEVKCTDLLSRAGAADDKEGRRKVTEMVEELKLIYHGFVLDFENVSVENLEEYFDSEKLKKSIDSLTTLLVGSANPPSYNVSIARPERVLSTKFDRAQIEVPAAPAVPPVPLLRAKKFTLEEGISRTAQSPFVAYLERRNRRRQMYLVGLFLAVAVIFVSVVSIWLNLSLVHSGIPKELTKEGNEHLAKREFRIRHRFDKLFVRDNVEIIEESR